MINVNSWMVKDGFINMSRKRKTDESYQGFEQGPIRPPNEAYSLLIRVTRNCPWNRCTFCPVYKGSRFSIRLVDHVKKDIDAIHTSVEMIRNMADEFGRIRRTEIRKAAGNYEPPDPGAFNAAGKKKINDRI